MFIRKGNRQRIKSWFFLCATDKAYSVISSACRGRKNLYFLGSNAKSSEKMRSAEYPRIHRQSITNDISKNHKDNNQQ